MTASSSVPSGRRTRHSKPAEPSAPSARTASSTTGPSVLALLGVLLVLALHWGVGHAQVDPGFTALRAASLVEAIGRHWITG